MQQRLTRPLLVAALLALPAAAAAQTQSADLTADPTSLLWGRQFTEWFYDGQADSLFSRFDDEMQKGLSKEDLIKFRDQVAVQAGAETEVLSEEVKEKDGFFNYHREIHVANAGETVVVVYWTIDKDKKIAGFFIKPKQS